ncbi:histidine-type phosphatase [Aeromicrobium sp.]|uniref:histidine-type phosphatase n=1 Tax=Aeromicrobium sp. TaxID=1871063 RepID=UPI0030BFEA02
MLKLVAMIIAAFAGVAAQSQVGPSIDHHHYANQTPYGNAAAAPIKTPPKGYQLAFLETVGRHGARTLTNSGAERRSLSVWKRAAGQYATTSLGNRFAKDLRVFQQAEQRVGYGNLSTIGAAEWRGIGRRTADSYRTFLAEATAAGDEVEFKTSGVQRTVDSAEAMESGLAAGIPGLKAAPYAFDPARLLIGNGASFAGNDAVEKILDSPEVAAASQRLLGRLYDKAFVDSLEDPVAAALDVYLLYCTAPGMRADSGVTFDPYVSLEDAKVLAYAIDAKNFYRYGPGVKGEPNSYQATKPLLRDFFAQLDKRLKGGDTAAVFRLAHGETTMPFAALLQLPGSGEQAPKREVFTYADNPWRGHVAGRLAGNIEWAAYRDRSGKALVTVRHNERPVKLQKSCRATVPFFYRPAELKRCLG